MGWKMNPAIPKEVGRCVMIAAPHTSNWDLIHMMGGYYDMKIPIKFTIKKEWFKFPFNLVIGPLGGIAIDRTPKKPGDPRPSTVEAMAGLFKENEILSVAVTPEGTRSLRKEWKTGFWHTAKLAGVPICLGYLDYAKKEAGVGKTIWPSDDMEKDMREIMAFYKTITPCHPELFSLDERYI